MFNLQYNKCTENALKSQTKTLFSLPFGSRLNYPLSPIPYPLFSIPYFLSLLFCRFQFDVVKGDFAHRAEQSDA
jgi:hypothetical protein